MPDFETALLSMLTIERNKGNITPESPIKAEDICRRWNEKFHDSKDYRAVGKAGESLRSKGYLIGSRSTEPAGYALCLTVSEYMEMNKGNISRAYNTLASYHAPLKAHKGEDQFKLFPNVVQLMTEFDLRQAS